MKNLFIVIFFMVALCRPAFATWSIIVVDPKTKEIGIAGASCTYSVYGIGAIVPGKGAIVVQAMSNPLARMKGVKMIAGNYPPEQILKAIMDPDFDPEEQQYGIVTVDHADKPQTYTGKLNHERRGAMTARGISVQGNTLTEAGAIKAIMDAALKAQKDGKPLHEILMVALEAGAKHGGDKRCGVRKASSAFLTVAKSNDPPKRPSLNLVIYGNDENIHAVEALRSKYNRWLKENR
jgi:uncharacterized Ntn-hydrolase superfamily protein